MAVEPWEDPLKTARRRLKEIEAAAKVPRECWSCVNIEVAQEVPDWSEVTPGEPATLECRKGHFGTDMALDNPSSLKRCLTMATDCADYEARPPDG